MIRSTKQLIFKYLFSSFGLWLLLVGNCFSAGNEKWIEFKQQFKSIYIAESSVIRIRDSISYISLFPIKTQNDSDTTVWYLHRVITSCSNSTHGVTASAKVGSLPNDLSSIATGELFLPQNLTEFFGFSAPFSYSKDGVARAKISEWCKRPAKVSPSFELAVIVAPNADIAITLDIGSFNATTDYREVWSSQRKVYKLSQAGSGISDYEFAKHSFFSKVVFLNDIKAKFHERFDCKKYKSVSTAGITYNDDGSVESKFKLKPKEIEEGYEEMIPGTLEQWVYVAICNL